LHISDGVGGFKSEGETCLHASWSTPTIAAAFVVGSS